MRKIILIIITLSCFWDISIARNRLIDSLKRDLEKATDDSVKVDILNTLALQLATIGSNDSAMLFATTAKEIAESHLKHASPVAQNKFKKNIALSLLNIGAVYENKGDYPKASENYFQSLRISESINDQPGIASAYQNIGDVYLKTRVYQEALKSYFQSLDVSRRIGDLSGMAVNYSCIGMVYDKQLNYDMALENYMQALKISLEINDTLSLADVYNNIGKIEFERGDYEKALKSYFPALKIMEAGGDKAGAVVSYLNIGEVYTKQKKLNKASKYLAKALQFSKETGNNDLLKDCYRDLALLAEAKGDYKSAYKYRLLYSETRNALINETNNRQIIEMRAKYEADEKEKEIKLLSKENEISAIRLEKQKAAFVYTIVGVSLFILFLFFYFRIYNQKRKALFGKQLLETEMKALRSQMNPHFTFNVLNSIQYYIAKNEIKAAQHYLTRFARLIRMILDQSKRTYITLEQEIALLKIYIELEEMRFEKKFKYSIHVDNSLNQNSVFLPGMLIQPVVENAIKYGIEQKSGDTFIEINFTSKISTLLCTVTDNGIGRVAAGKLKSNKDPHESSATFIINERIRLLGLINKIKLNYVTEDLYNNDKPGGTRVSIEIPLHINPA